MELLNYFFISAILFNCYCNGGDLDYDGKLNIKLDHSLDHTQTPLYFNRGEINIKSLHSGVATIEEFDLTFEQTQLLRDLAKKGGNYRLRSTVKNPDGKENYYYTFVKACSLIESQLNNILSINLDHNGNVIALSMVVPKKYIEEEIEDSQLKTFNTSVEVRHMELGPVPDTATYIQKIEREREAKERGETKDNRSFLAKYWMYIVPVLIFMLLPSGGNPESGNAPAQR